MADSTDDHTDPDAAPAEPVATGSGITMQVLGPLAAFNGDDELALGGPKQKAVLAVLVAAGGRTVSADLIAQAVYGEDAPPRARRRVQTYVSTLRSVLGETIVRQGDGWALALDPDAIDAGRFESLLKVARQQRAADAATTLRDALALWRGAPYAQIESHGRLDSEISRLEELRLQAVEARIDADLDSGRTNDVVAELSALVAEHPYREGLRARHMLALYRSGRQQEALASFDRLRERLLEDLGVDPSRDLRELEQRILQQDDSLRQTAEPDGRPLRGYRLIEQIGSGAFSIVWRGVQPSVNRDVAIKQIRSELASRPEFIRRFEAEAQIVARIEHPHIVPLIDYWRDPDSAYLVMRWLRGGTVERSLDDGPWTLDRTLNMTRQVGDALTEAHAFGVVHRDVKTANILLDDGSNAFLGDFGIALAAAESAGPEAALSQGSPAYASPEQLRREPLGPGSDIFSLGVVVFECLAGRLPFAEERNVAELVKRQLADEYPLLSAVRPEVPSHVVEAVRRATAKNLDERFETVGEFVDALHDGESSAVHAPSRHTIIGGELANPYKGLRAFDEVDAGEFFGRERLVDELVDRLDGPGVDARCLIVTGPSGSGKSSVVRAGLVPAVRAGRVPGSESWFTTMMVPGSNPYEALEAALLRIAVNPPTSLVQQLVEGPRGILRAVRRCLANDDDRVLLVVDQLEELFTSTTAEQADSFLTAMAVAVQDPGSPLRVVATLRADYFGQPLAHTKFAPILKVGAVAVPPLAPDELELAITAPAERRGLHFEPGLVARVASEAAGQAGPLPLLQYTLSELFDHRAERKLTLEAFEDLGGLAGALAARAERLYSDATTEEQNATRRLFGALINPDERSTDLRRRARIADLGDDNAMEVAIDRYGSARLLTFDREVTSREPTVEVAHEALLREWPRLRTWLNEDRELLGQVQHLATASDTWHAGGRAIEDLYRGGRLETATALITESPDRLRPMDRSFVQESLAAAERDADTDRRRVRRLRRLVAVVGAALVVALFAGAFAFQQQRRANDEAALATANEQLAQAAASSAEEQRSIAAAQRAQADAAASDADRQRAQAEAAAAEAESERSAADAAREVAEARALVASASDVLGEDDELSLLLATQGAASQPGDPTATRVLRQALQAPLRLYAAPLDLDTYSESSTMSSDGRVIVGVGERWIEARSVDTGETLWQYDHGLAGQDRDIVPAFLDQDSMLVVATRFEQPDHRPGQPIPDGIGMYLLDAAAGEFVRQVPIGECGAHLFADSSRGQSRMLIWQLTSSYIAENGCGLNEAGIAPAQAYVIDIETGDTLPVGTEFPIGPRAPRSTMTISADLTRVAAAGGSGVVVTDVASGEEIFQAEAGFPFPLRLSNNGDMLVTGGTSPGDGGAVRVFDVDSGELIDTLAGHPGATYAARFISDETRLLTSGDDGRVNTWDLASGGLMRSVATGAFDDLWIDTEENRIATMGTAISVVSNDPAASAEVGVIDVCDEDANAIYVPQGLVVRDERVLSFTGCGGSAGLGYVVDLNTGEELAVGVLAATRGYTMSWDGSFIASQEFVGAPPDFANPTFGSIVVTNVDTGENTELTGLCEWALPDDPGCEMAPEAPHALLSDDLDFSPDDRMLSASSLLPGPSGVIWDLNANEVLARWNFFHAAFSHDGQTIATLSQQDASGVHLEIRDTTTFEILDEIVASRDVRPGNLWFTPDGQRLLTSSLNDVLVFGTNPLQLEGSWVGAHDAVIETLTISDDGSMVATVAIDGTAMVRDLETGDVLHDIHVSQDDRVNGVAFARNDSQLLVSLANGPIPIFTLDHDELLSIARGRLLRGFTYSECDRYFDGRHCPSLAEMRSS